ncbi:MAG: hypothetical protein NC110_05625 [Ruminococcus sp.]|nr:hypothetical protein [Ruminococcus sp.]
MKDRSKIYKGILIALTVACFIASCVMHWVVFLSSVTGSFFEIDTISTYIIPIRGLFVLLLVLIAATVITFKAKFAEKHVNKVFAVTFVILVVIAALTSIAAIRSADTYYYLSMPKEASSSEEAQEYFPHYQIDNDNINLQEIELESSAVATYVYARGYQSSSVYEIEYIKTASPMVRILCSSAKNIQISADGYDAKPVSENINGVNIEIYETSTDFTAIVKGTGDFLSITMKRADLLKIDAQAFANGVSEQYKHLKQVSGSDTFFGEKV